MNLEKKIQYLIVDTTAFIQNAQLQNVAENIITCPEVINEVTSKRQLRRLVTLPYDLQVKESFPEYLAIITEFSKKTGDYRSLSATDLKVIALTYQLEKEHVGTEHLRSEPIVKSYKNVIVVKGPPDTDKEDTFFKTPESDETITDKDSDNSDDNDDEDDWITPSNVKQVQKQIQSANTVETIDKMTVACMTTDFAMQNVLKQINLQVAALDGRQIRELRTFLLRCYACFKITPIVTKRFCPHCGHDTLKKVATYLNNDGNLEVYINSKKPLTARGKCWSLPAFKGGKHSNNPIIVADQPMPDNRPSRLAKTKNNPLHADYIAGISPFVTRDVNSRSAILKIRPDREFKHWMQRNPNEARRRRK